MKLKSVHIQKYKNLTDSTEFSIEDHVTCLVGKNESGKTAALECIYRLNPVPSGLRTAFEELYDYPKVIRSADNRRGIVDSTTPITATFILDEDDIDNLNSVYSADCFLSTEIVISIDYENEKYFDFDIDENCILNAIFAAQLSDERISASALESFVSFSSFIQSNLENEALTDIVAQYRDTDIADHIHNSFINEIEGMLPKILYFDQYNQMPGRFSIPYIQNTPEESLTKEERTALSFLRLAGADSEELIESNYEARRAAIESAQVGVTNEVFEFWRQNENIRVTVDPDFVGPPDGVRGVPFLDVRIFNDQQQVSINFSERSTGFIWFFSFLTFFSEFREEDEPLIILLDEPGLGLHAAGQADLLRFIDERLADQHQIIYTTHSPFMIKPDEIERTRTVEYSEENQSRISDDVFTSSRDTLFPLQAALGYELSQSLFVGPHNLLVEGPSDLIYLQVFSEYLASIHGSGLDERWTIVPVGGIDNIPTFVALLGAHLDVAAIVDHAPGQNQRIENMIRRGLLEPTHFIPLTEITASGAANIEDMFTPGFYLNLLSNTGIATLQVADLGNGNTLISRVEDAIGHTFSHYRPAAYLLREQNTLLTNIPNSIIENFEALFERINGLLPGN